MLTLSFLGTPLVERDGAAVEVRRRKVLALLAYLAVTGRPHGRDEMTDLLYPVPDRGHAGADFRTILSLLKRAIGDALEVSGDCVAVRADDHVRIDVREVRRLLGDARTADRAGDERSAGRLLTAAVPSFRGEFLAGFSLPDSARFDEWEEQERDDLRHLHAWALERLAGIRESRGEFAEAIVWARQRVVLDPLDEPSVRTLMRLHAREGNRTAALRQYDRLVELLRAQMGESPDPETAALREKIARGRVAPARRPPPPYGPAAPATNLPHPPSPLVGRRRELAAVTKALRGGATRLVTLTGPGGMGKTRLALEAAWKLRDGFPHGTWFVDLAPLTNASAVVPSIAAALGMQEAHGAPDRRARKRPLIEQLLDYLRGRRLLMVLDNFEHLLPAATVVADILGACPGVKVLATSRQTLHLRTEREVGVPPLGLPEPGQTWAALSKAEAVRFFCERAVAVRPGFSFGTETVPAIAEICRMLDGMPLAIELAAAKLKTFAPPALLERLAHRLQVLEDGPCDLPARQRTLRGAIGWSWDLLDDRERRVFERLSVFCGGCTAEAAAAVCLPEAIAGSGGAEPVLESLVDKSLLQARGIFPPRFHLLDTIREYAGERLEASGEAADVRRRFADWLIALAEREEARLYGPEQADAFSVLDAEYPNLRAAITMLQEQGDCDRLVRLAGALGWYWFRRARFSEGRQLLRSAIAAAGADVPLASQARAHFALGLIERCTGRLFTTNPLVKKHAEEACRLWRKAGNRRGTALALALLGTDEADLEEPNPVLAGDALRHFDESVAEASASRDPWTIAWCLKMAYGQVERRDRDVDALRAGLEEAIGQARHSGDPFLECQVANGMGQMYLMHEMPGEAIGWLENALRIAREIGDRWSLLDTLNRCGCSLRQLGRIEEARSRWGEGLRLAVDLGAAAYLCHLFGGFDYLARNAGRPRRAMKLMGFAVKCGDPGLTLDHFIRGKPFGPSFGMDIALLRAEWDAGRAMTLDEAVAYALSDED